MTKTAQTPLTWDQPHDVDQLTAIFPANVTRTLLPPMDRIPQEFKSYSNPWSKKVSGLFFSGGQLPPVKEGVDQRKARLHLQAVLGSFEPKHEHKIAGAAWLMSMWYQD